MKKILTYFLSLSAWFGGLLAFFLGTLLILLVGVFHTGALFEWTVKTMCRLVIFAAGIRLKVSGLENVDRDKQYLIMMNHVNLLDPFMFYTRYPGKARGVEEESHFTWPIYGWVIRRIGQFPINRKSGRRALETLKKAGELIRTQKEFSVVLLPEGTRTMTGKLGEFKKGGFLLALEAGLDILPIIQIGSFKFKRKGNWLMRPGRVELVYEKPIRTSDYSRKTINDLMRDTREVFLKYVD